MYSRDMPKLPVSISRNEFVELVFSLGYENSHGYDTIVATVQLGDYFVSYSGPRTPYREFTSIERNLLRDRRRQLKCIQGTLDFATESRLVDEILAARTEHTFMDECVSQIYSVELAHIATIIVAKYNEDFGSGYRFTNKAISDTVNCYVRKMEWEILTLIGFKPKVYNFISVIGALIMEVNKLEYPPVLGTVFLDISKDVCLDKELLSKDPWTVVLGLIILAQKGKLRALRLHRERVFRETMKAIAREYELEFEDVIRAYIELKTV